MRSCVGCSNFEFSGVTDNLACHKLSPSPFIRLHHVKDAQQLRSQTARAETCDKFEEARPSA